jgi:uncharacterized membrane-anchored protein YitT (DUF2179 family)
MKPFKEIFNTTADYVMITIGLAISAFGWTALLIPSKIVGGGVTGIATILHFAFGLDVGLMSLLINIGLVLIAIKMLGSSFGIKTIYAIIVFSIFLSFFGHYFTEPILKTELFMTTIIGGIICGTGGGIVFIHGGSTGGTDIIAMIINQYRNISLGRLLLMMDVIIISSSFFIFQSPEKIAYGLITMSVLAYTVDVLITGTKQTIQLFIISQKHTEIAAAIIKDANRGVTVLNGQGAYTGEEVKVLMVMARKRESSMIFRIIKHIDPKAFITLTNAMGVYGKGFDTMKLS